VKLQLEVNFYKGYEDGVEKIKALQ